MNRTIIALDTNIWIYLAKTSARPLFKQLQKAVHNEEIEIITNDVVLLEWNRNKQKTIDGVVSSIRNELVAAINIAYFIKEQSERDKFLQTIQQYKDENKRIEEAEGYVEVVEQFMKSCTCLPVTNQQKLYVADLAIQKKRPFEGGKSNFNDALIIRNFAEYASQEVSNKGGAFPFKYDFIIVSNNPKDFSDEKTGIVFPELLHGIPSLNMCNVRDLGHALEESSVLVEDFDAWLEWQVTMHAELEAEIMRGK